MRTFAAILLLVVLATATALAGGGSPPRVSSVPAEASAPAPEESAR